MKKFTAIFLCIIIALNGSGCMTISLTPEVETDEEIIERQAENIVIGFSSGTDLDVIDFVMTPEELKAWKNPYGEYSSYILYESLNENEKLAYHALEYAMVNSYNYTFFDSRISLSKLRLDFIPYALALDSPFLEQNLMSIVISNTAAFYDYKYSESRTVSVLHRSNCFSVKNFTEELWDSKMEALREAEEIIKTFDTSASQIELAEEIFRYMAQNVEYIPYKSEEGIYQGNYAPFLYDALVNKKTHCDGYTNGLALLYAMAGFEQVEKETKGHTFNCIKIGNDWYNVDGTAGGWIPDRETSMHAGLYFAFPDYYLKDTVYYKKLYPVSNRSYYMNPDGRFANCDEPEFYEEMYEGFAKHDYEWTLLYVSDYDEEAESYYTQRLANELMMNLQIYHTDSIGDSSLILVCESGIFNN